MLGLILLDGDRRVVGWNVVDGGRQRHRATPMLRAGVSAKLFPGRIPARLDTAISHALELGASGLVTHSLHSSVFPLRTQSGRKLLHNISIRPVGDRPKLGCLLQIVDVTVVAGRERILRERQNARYDAVVGGAPDAILTLDAERRDPAGQSGGGARIRLRARTS